MCLPLLAPVGVALGASVANAATVGTLATTSLVAGAVGAYGAYQQGQSAKSMNNYQSAVLGQQAVLAQRNADANTTIVQNQAAYDSKNLAKRNAQLQGAQAATMAANGTAGGTTAADIKVDTFDTGKLDQLAVQYNANLKTWGIQNQLAGEKWQLGVESDQYRMAGKNAATAGNINSATSLIGSAAQIANTKLMANYYGRQSVSGY